MFFLLSPLCIANVRVETQSDSLEDPQLLLHETNSDVVPTVRVHVELEVPTLGPHARCTVEPFVFGGEQGWQPRLLEKKCSWRGSNCKRVAKQECNFEHDWLPPEMV